MTERRLVPVIAAGAIVRLGLIAFCLPLTHQAWFAPFLTFLAEARHPDVWAQFLQAGGAAAAFPYGLPYIVAFAPGALIGDAIGGVNGAAIGIGLTTLALDAALLIALRRLAPPDAVEAVTALYWLSPIVLYIGYWHGQLDVLPALLLTLAFLFLKRQRFLASAALAGVAVAAKVSMALAVPIILIYLYSSPRYRPQARAWVLAFLVASLALLLPVASLDGFRAMVLGTPELQKGAALAIAYDRNLTLYVLPMVYAGLLLATWRIRRFSFEELMSLTGVAFIALYLLTPASPGWAMWFTGFLALHAAQAGLTGAILYSAFSVAFVALHLMISSGATVRLFGGLDLTRLPWLDAPFTLMSTSGLAFSALAVVGVALVLQMLRTRVLESNYHLATRKPWLVGIGGDSGSGKDTLGALITDMFGAEAVCTVSGDDYHIWDRNKPMWRALTHLHPRANDLDRFARDAFVLAERRSVRAPHYDHQVGRMTKPQLVRPRDIVVASGLHALHTPALNARADLKVFLDMHEGLRRYLKVRRDVSVRGHALDKVLGSLDRRAPDSDRFIRPQRANADLVITLEPMRPGDVEDFSRDVKDVPLRLCIEFRAHDNVRRLERHLISLCGLHVVGRHTDDGAVQLMIEGTPTADQVCVAARSLAPDMAEHLALEPVWRGEQNGLLQLVLLDQIDQRRAAFGGVM